MDESCDKCPGMTSIMSDFKSKFLTKKIESSEEMGRSTWYFLHGIAKYYSENASEAEQESALALINAIVVLYPCKKCAMHFKETILCFPPMLKTKKDFILWLCKCHNIVNARLYKSEFNCNDLII